MSDFHGQTASFVARIAQNLPALSSSEMQWWFDNPKKLQKFLLGLKEGGGAHMIDLAAAPQLPFERAVVETNRGSGVVRLERRGDDLFLDGKKISLFRSERQLDGKSVVGHELRVEIEGRGNNLPAVVLDYLEVHPELWPESWKKDAEGNTIYVFFWDTIFRNPSNGNLYVRYGYWHDGRVISFCNWLDIDWNGCNPAASLEQVSA